jgi:phosphonate transport system substrate-binding protein
MTSKLCVLISVIILTSLAVVSGCGRDSDAVVVDFNKTIVVERPESPIPELTTFNVAVAAMISPKETFGYYRQLLDYIGEKLGREVQFIQRKTYGEINELLGIGQIDLAFICSGPYAAGKEEYDFELVATPQVQESSYYQSYLIVNNLPSPIPSPIRESWCRPIGFLKTGSSPRPISAKPFTLTATTTRFWPLPKDWWMGPPLIA